MPIAGTVVITAAANQPFKAETIKCSTIAKRFLQDVEVAEQTKFPVSTANYGIELVGHASYGLSAEWVGGFTGTTQTKSYNQAFYWGQLFVKTGGGV